MSINLLNNILKLSLHFLFGNYILESNKWELYT